MMYDERLTLFLYISVNDDRRMKKEDEQIDSFIKEKEKKKRN